MAVTSANAAGAADRGAPVESADFRPPGLAKQDTLRWLAPKDFYIGTAVAGGGHHLSQPYPDPFSYDDEYRRILAAEFSSVSPENQMKWDFIHPERDRYNFGPADAIVEFAEEHGQVVRGHTLLWHSQNPAWLQNGNFSDAELRAILKEHISTVVGRYAGRIQQWDVANEIFTDTWEGGPIRLRPQNIWIQRLGPGIIATLSAGRTRRTRTRSSSSTTTRSSTWGRRATRTTSSRRSCWSRASRCTASASRRT